VVETRSRAPYHRGGARLGALATAESRISTVTRSEIEERFLALIRRAGLSLPQANADVGRFTVDLLWEPIRLVVEVDGYQFHSTHRVFEADRARDLELGAAGYEVMRFTWHQVADQPEFVLARLTQRMTELAAQSGRSSRKVS
jgi:very-short-patch-repair endonuclease